jgi:hypothetical protein
MNKYQSWIKCNYPTVDSARWNCSTATKKMVTVFPELTRVRGWYGGIEHWWCKTSEGKVVDPTVHQFAHKREYKEFREGVDPEPIGKCMICSAYCWEGKSPSSCACSSYCQEELQRDYA